MKKYLLLTVFAAVLLTMQSVFAQEEKTEKKLPKRGSLSVSSSGTSASKNIPDPWGVEDVTSSESPPITGSVSKVSPTRWVARIMNNSEDTYSVSLAVYQFSRNNTKIKSDSFSYTLKPKETVERPVAALTNTEQCELDLISWTKKSSAKK